MKKLATLATLITLTACAPEAAPPKTPPPPSPAPQAEAAKIANRAAESTTAPSAAKEDTPAAPAPAPAPAPVGKWDVSKEVSKLDDSENVFLVLGADILVTNKFNETYSPKMLLTCREKRLEAYIDWDTFVHSESSAVTTRIDSAPAVTKHWSVSTNYKATFAPQPLRFIKSLVGHQKLVVRVVPYGDAPLLTEFDLTGLDQHIKTLYDACRIH